MDINANNLILFNRTKLPKSKIYLDKVINYINEELNPRFIKMNIYSRKITTKKKVQRKLKISIIKNYIDLKLMLKRQLINLNF